LEGRGGGEEFFSRDQGFFYREGGRRGRTRKKDPMPKELFFPFSAGFTVPTATSRLGQPTNGGNARRVGSGKKAAWASDLFSGVGRGEVKKSMHGTWIATGERVLSQTQIPWSASSKRRGGEGGRQGYQPTHTINNTGPLQHSQQIQHEPGPHQHFQQIQHDSLLFFINYYI
jgi:hypothetical protein